MTTIVKFYIYKSENRNFFKKIKNNKMGYIRRIIEIFIIKIFLQIKNYYFYDTFEILGYLYLIFKHYIFF